ncbi:MAG: hypothetical protein IJO29_01590 [Oscillospiraceae bacterium]|nr:hypothetical protein [Oscillospiraceae bacterium]
MKSINFQGGSFKEYALNGDESNAIRINVSDYGIITRFNEAKEKIGKLCNNFKEIDYDVSVEDVKEADEFIRNQIDYVFGADTAAKAFGSTNCISLNQSGQPICIAFLDALLPILEHDIKSAANAQNMSVSLDNEKTAKYISQSKQSAKPFIPMAQPALDISNLSPEQKAEILKQLLT